MLHTLWLVSYCVYIYISVNTVVVSRLWFHNSSEFGQIRKYLYKPLPRDSVSHRLSNSPKLSLILWWKRSKPEWGSLFFGKRFAFITLECPVRLDRNNSLVRAFFLTNTFYQIAKSESDITQRVVRLRYCVRVFLDVAPH